MSQSHNFQQRRQERMRGTGTSSVTQSSQKFQFKLPPPSGGSHASSALPRPTASSGSGASSGRQSLGSRPLRDAATRAPRDPYVFSGSTAPGGPGSGNAMSPPPRSAGGASGARSNGMPSSGASRSTSAQQPPRSAMKGARASTSGRPSLPASGESRTSLGKRRATQEEEDDLEAERFEDEPVVDISVDSLPPDASFDRSPARADKSVSFKQLPSSSSRRKSLKDTSKGKQTSITQFTTGKRSGPVPSSSTSRSKDDEHRRKKSRQSSPPRPPPRDSEKARKRREAEKQRDRERADAKKAAAAINERNKKRRRTMGDEDDEDEDDGDPEYEVEFEDDDEDGGAGPDTTLQEEVIIGARMVKDARRMNGQTAKMMRKRLRRAIRLALEEDPDDGLDDPDASGAAPAARKRRASSADKLTDADVIWSVLDAEVKAASTSQASSIASSTLRELRKIIRTLFEGLSIKASERRELISQLERARSRKKRIRREVFEARRVVLENEEEINRIRKESVDSANRAKTAEESLSFFQKLQAVRDLWT